MSGKSVEVACIVDIDEVYMCLGAE